MPTSFALLAILAGVTTPPGTAAEALSQAQSALQRGDYGAAAQGYAQAATLLPRCEVLEYDTGTAAAEAEQVGPAVLHLDRALRESPWDTEARQNLERIRQKRIDKVMGQEPGESPLQRLIAEVPGRVFFWIGLLGWWVGFVFVALQVAGLARRQFWLPIAAILVSISLVGLSLAWQLERETAYAVVLGGGSQGIKVHSGPAADLPTSFEVHDGLKVLILDAENGFTHIRLGNGLEGYVPEGDIEAI
jgi:hypothetical protein